MCAAGRQAHALLPPSYRRAWRLLCCMSGTAVRVSVLSCGHGRWSVCGCGHAHPACARRYRSVHHAVPSMHVPSQRHSQDAAPSLRCCDPSPLRGAVAYTPGAGHAHSHDTYCSSGQLLSLASVGSAPHLWEGHAHTHHTSVLSPCRSRGQRRALPVVVAIVPVLLPTASRSSFPPEG